MSAVLRENAQDLEQELAWFTEVVDTRFKLYFGQESEHKEVFALTPPDLSCSSSQYARIVQHYKMTFAERLCLILSLVPHIRPQLLDVFHTKNKTLDRKFTEFGGVKGKPDRDFFPTGETLSFLLACNNLEIRFGLHPLLGRDHFFTRNNLLDLRSMEAGWSPLKTPLRISEEYLSLLTNGQVLRPHFSAHFPAQYIETTLDWEDLVLDPSTLSMVKEIENWIQHSNTLLNDWQMAGRIRPGYRTLFYGPPGTGKTITASLLGKSTGYDVYRVDLSSVISKYIGETEKNLSRIFDMAENKNWILFFDEADAIFGKRSETKDAHDRYANQEVSYLLQRIETFNGIAILASNLKENLDKAFTRRFESMILFPMPGPQERLRLWQQGFSDKARLAEDIDLQQIATNFEMSGGTIMNVIRFASLQALEAGGNEISLKVLMQGIRREFSKEGRIG